MAILYISSFALSDKTYKFDIFNSLVGFDTQILELLSFVTNKKIYYYSFNKKVYKQVKYNLKYFKNNITTFKNKDLQIDNYNLLLTNDIDILNKYHKNNSIYYNVLINESNLSLSIKVINNINLLLKVINE